MNMGRSLSSLVSLTHSTPFLAYTVLALLILINQIEISHGRPGPPAPGPPALPHIHNTKLPGNIAEMVYAVNLPNTKQTVLLTPKGEIKATFPSSMYGNNAMSAAATSATNGPSFNMPIPDKAPGSMPTNMQVVPSNPYQRFSSSLTSSSGAPFLQGGIPRTPDSLSAGPSINQEISQKSQKLISDIRNILKSNPSPAAMQQLQNILNIASKSKPSLGALNALQTALDFTAKTGGMPNILPASTGVSNTATVFNTAGYAQNPVMFNEFPAKETRFSTKGGNAGLGSNGFRGQTANQAFNKGDPFGLQNMIANMPISGSQADLFGSMGGLVSNAGGYLPSQVKKTPNAQNSFTGMPMSGSQADLFGSTGGLVSSTGGHLPPQVKKTPNAQNSFTGMPMSGSQTDLFGSMGGLFSNTGGHMPTHVKKTSNAQKGALPPVHHHHIHGVDMNTLLFGLLNKAKPAQGIPPTGTNVGPLGQGGMEGGPELFVVTGENSMHSPQFQTFLSQLTQAFKTSGSRTMDKRKGTGLHSPKSAKKPTKPNTGAPGAPPKGGKPAPPVDPEAAAEAAAEAAEAAEAALSSAPPAPKKKSKKAGSRKGKRTKKTKGKAAVDKASPAGGMAKGYGQQTQGVNGAQMSNTGGQYAAESNIAGNQQQFQNQMPYTGGQNLAGFSGGGQMSNPNAPISYSGGGHKAPVRPAGGKQDQIVSAEMSGNQAAIAAAEAAENIEAGVRASSNANQRKSSSSAVQGSGAYPTAGRSEVSPHGQYGPPTDFGVPPNYAPQEGQGPIQGSPGPSAM